MRLARPLPILALAAALALLAGCGSSSSEQSQSQTQPSPAAKTSTAPIGASAQGCGTTTAAGTGQLRVTGVGCAVGRGVVAAWINKPACSTDTSRPTCTVADYRCIGARTDAGIAVSCATKGRSISFIAKRG